MSSTPPSSAVPAAPRPTDVRRGAEEAGTAAAVAVPGVLDVRRVDVAADAVGVRLAADGVVPLQGLVPAVRDAVAKAVQAVTGAPVVRVDVEVADVAPLEQDPLTADRADQEPSAPTEPREDGSRS